MNARPYLLPLLACLALTLRSAADETAEPAEPEKQLLAYKFQPGQLLRWEVEHRSNIRTTIDGTTDANESFSGSIKVWRVTDVADDGNITFQYSVERVRMRQKAQGRQEVLFDSTEGGEPPPQFAAVAKSVGVPLTVFTINPRGEIVKRVDAESRPAGSDDAQITMILPEMPVGPGDQWSVPADVTVSKGTRPLTVKTRQLYTLVSIQNGIAVVQTETQVLTPIDDPEIEAQLVQRSTSGEVRFDVEEGRVVSQQLDVDKSVVGFRGAQSVLTCLMRLNEVLIDDGEPTARRNPLRQ